MFGFIIIIIFFLDESHIYYVPVFSQLLHFLPRFPSFSPPHAWDRSLQLPTYPRRVPPDSSTLKHSSGRILAIPSRRCSIAGLPRLP